MKVFKWEDNVNSAVSLLWYLFKVSQTRLLFDWQPCQRVNEDWHSNIENAAFIKLETQVFSWHCFFCGRLHSTLSSNKCVCTLPDIGNPDGFLPWIPEFHSPI